MAEFLPAVQYVLLNEGGFTNNPSDPGGATNFGIEQREMPGVDIRSITRDQAISFYLSNYWNKVLYANLASQQVATKLFDMHVNLGLESRSQDRAACIGIPGRECRRQYGADDRSGHQRRQPGFISLCGRGLGGQPLQIPGSEESQANGVRPRLDGPGQ